MFRLHEYGTEAGDFIFDVIYGGILPGIMWKKTCRKFGESKVEIIFGGFVEDRLRKRRGSLWCRGVDSPEDDVELRRVGRGEEVRRFGEAVVEFEGGGVAGFEALGESSARDVGEKLLGRPESYGGGTGAGAFE